MAAHQYRILKKIIPPGIFALWTAFEFVHTYIKLRFSYREKKKRESEQ